MHNNHILIIEDDDEIARLSAMYLNSEGYTTSIVTDGIVAVETIKALQPDLVILDLMLPGIDGIEICKQTRDFYQGPILILTACDDEFREVNLLKLGADDYLNKPVKPHIMLARIEALLRRSKISCTQQQQISTRLIQIDTTNQTVRFKGQLLDLTGAEYDMLQILTRNAGKTVSREICSRALRGIDYSVSDRSIDMRISGLRKKLQDEKAPYQIIKTIRSKGYMLINE